MPAAAGATVCVLAVGSASLSPAAATATTAPRQSPVTVAVIDSGVSDVAALDGSVWWSRSRGFVPGEGLNDGFDHGTGMAVIIHRSAPRARLLALKVLDDTGAGSDTTTARAIRYAVNRGARIVNLSISGAAPQPKVQSAIEYAARHATLVVVAAGNDAINVDVAPTYPVSYRLPNLVGVAATDGHGRLTASSNWGRRSVTIGAWGLDVPTFASDSTPTTASGSSTAAAITTGAAAEILSRRPRLSVKRLRRLLVRTGDSYRSLVRVTTSGRQIRRSSWTWPTT